MPDSAPQRLGSVHLEDLAIVALGAAANQDKQLLHPDLDTLRRARLRSRLKQIGRHDWPSSLAEDPLLRRGYTLRQCYRIIAALLLIDAHLAPSEAIALAKANELNIQRAIAPKLTEAEHGHCATSSNDLLMIVPLGELVSLVAEKEWRQARAQALRLVRRGDLSSLWSLESDLGFPGQRLVIDIGVAAAAVWRWMSERQLMTGTARLSLLAEIEAARGESGFTGITNPILRQR